MNVSIIGPPRYGQLLADVAQYYGKDGYSVVVNPAATDIPDAFKSLHADMIAQKGGEHLLIEVKVPGRARRLDYWQEAKQAVDSVPHWQYVVIVPGESEGDLEETDVSESKIEGLLAETEQLLKSNHNNAALLTSSIALELALRVAASRNGLPVHIPSVLTLLAAVYNEGEIDPNLYPRLRSIMSLRNKIAHGQVTDPVTEDDVNTVISAIRDLQTTE